MLSKRNKSTRTCCWGCQVGPVLLHAYCIYFCAHCLLILRHRRTIEDQALWCWACHVNIQKRPLPLFCIVLIHVSANQCCSCRSFCMKLHLHVAITMNATTGALHQCHAESVTMVALMCTSQSPECVPCHCHPCTLCEVFFVLQLYSGFLVHNR